MVNLNDEKLAEFVGIVLGDGSIGIYNCFSNGVIKKQHRLKISFDSREKRRRFLYSYVNWYNHVRPHQSLDGKTPLQRLKEYFTRIQEDLKSVRNA